MENQNETTAQESAVASKAPISVSGVIEMLESGLDRKEIGKKLGLKADALKKLFKHPQLAGRRTKVGKSIEEMPEIVDDVTGTEKEQEVKDFSDRGQSLREYRERKAAEKLAAEQNGGNFTHEG